MTAAPSDPFTLSTHLIDDHHQDQPRVDLLDADQLRAYHAACHATGLPDHDHEDRP